MTKPKEKRRKCYICGRYGKGSEMVHGGVTRVMYSEAAFAHKQCVTKQKLPPCKSGRGMTKQTNDQRMKVIHTHTSGFVLQGLF